MDRRPGGPAALTRRAWMAVVAVGAATWAIGCGDNDPGEASAVILEPTSTAFLVAIWSRGGGTVVVELRVGALLLAELPVALGTGETGVVDVTGLTPDRSYELTIRNRAGLRVGPYRVRTAPDDQDRRPVRLAVSADFDPHPSFDSALVDHLLAAEPELFVSLGDFPYTDNGPPAQTVAEYRARHVDLRLAPAARRLFEGVPVRAIYDDHEFRNDWDAAFVQAEPARYAAAMQVWDEFFPIRAATGDVRYRSWRWGAHVECFLLDCRRFRSANAATDDATKHMLGDAQRAWLVEGVTRSPATFKLVFTSVPLDFGLGTDHWASFTTERARVLDALVGTPGVLFISADQHYFAAHRHAHGVRELQVGPLARGLGPAGPPAPGVLFRSHQLNAGVLDISDDRLVITGLGADGQRFYTEQLSAADLTPR